MEKLVPLLELLLENPDSAVRKVLYTPDSSRIVFDYQQTGCSLSEKDEQEAKTETGHQWYPFAMIDGEGVAKNILCIVPDAVPKFKLCLEGWSGYIDQMPILSQFSNVLYGNRAMKTVGLPLSRSAIRSMARFHLLDLIVSKNRVWVGTYAKPDMGMRMLKLQYIEKISEGKIQKFTMYDLDRGKAHLHEASILPIIRLPSTVMVNRDLFERGGVPLKRTLPSNI